MIKGECSTNLKLPEEIKWPTTFVAVPRVGEWVSALDPISHYSLMVKEVYHKEKGTLNFRGEVISRAPYIVVWLGKREK